MTLRRFTPEAKVYVLYGRADLERARLRGIVIGGLAAMTGAVVGRILVEVLT